MSENTKTPPIIDRTVDRLSEGESDAEALVRNQLPATERARNEAEATRRIRSDPRWRAEGAWRNRRRVATARAKLTEDQARAIMARKAEYFAQPRGQKVRFLKRVAAEYGISYRAADGIIRGDTWAWLEDED